MRLSERPKWQNGGEVQCNNPSVPGWEHQKLANFAYSFMLELAIKPDRDQCHWANLDSSHKALILIFNLSVFCTKTTTHYDMICCALLSLKVLSTDRDWRLKTNDIMT